MARDNRKGEKQGVSLSESAVGDEVMINECRDAKKEVTAVFATLGIVVKETDNEVNDIDFGSESDSEEDIEDDSGEGSDEESEEESESKGTDTEVEELENGGLVEGEMVMDHNLLSGVSIDEVVDTHGKNKTETFFVTDSAGNKVHKAQVVASMNIHGKASADRNLRYKECKDSVAWRQDLTNKAWILKQGDDACSLFTEKGKKKVYYGNVLHIRRQKGKKKTELYDYVDLNVDNSREGTENLVFIMSWYKKNADGTYEVNLDNNVYDYELPATSIICPVDMHVVDNGGKKLQVNEAQQQIIKNTLSGRRFWTGSDEGDDTGDSDESENERQDDSVEEEAEGSYSKQYTSSYSKSDRNDGRQVRSTTRTHQRKEN